MNVPVDSLPEGEDERGGRYGREGRRAALTTAAVARGGNDAAVAAMEVEAAAIGESLELRQNVWPNLFCLC